MTPHNTDKLRALIVDDTSALLSCFKLLLRPLEHTWDILYATSGEEALDIVCEAPVDLLICDLNMPLMPGDEVVSLVRLRTPDTVCFLMTGCAHDDALVANICGLSGIFHKPCDIEQIKGALNAHSKRLALPMPQAA